MTGSQKIAQARALNTALEYLEKGFSVIRFQAYWPDPAKRGDEKKPLGEWKRYQTELATEADLRSWFSKPAGIGLVCGPISGGLVVFDFEAEEVWLRFEKLAREAGLTEILEEAPTVRSPNGIHLWLMAPKAVTSFSIYDPSIPTNKKAEGLIAEVRSTGPQGRGQLVIAPGGHPGAHPSGKPYEWISEGWMMDDGKPRPLDEATFSRLLALLKSMDKGKPNAPKKVANKPALETEDKPHTKDRFNGETTWEELLEPDGWKKTKGPFNHDKYGPGTCEWLRPGKEGAGCSATTSANILYVFSSSTSLPTEEGIDRFEYFAQTRFAGIDYKTKAAAHLHKQWDEQDRAALLAENPPQVDPSRSLRVERPMEPFPIDALPTSLQEFVLAQAEAKGVDPAAIATPLLAVVGGTIGRSRLIMVNESAGWYESPHLWTVLVASSGTRKSPSINASCTPAQAINERLMAEYRDAREAYEQELTARRASDEKNGPPPEPPKNLRLVVADATVESLIYLFKDNPCGLLLIRNELSQFFSSLVSNKYQKSGGGDLDIYLELHDPQGYAPVDRIGREAVDSRNNQISITGTITPGGIAKYFNAFSWERGLPQRFLFCKPIFKDVYWDDLGKGGREAQEWFATFLESLHKLREQPAKTLNIANEALPIWGQAYDRRQDELKKLGETNEARRSRIGKLRSCYARWALAYQVVQDPLADEVGKEAIAAGIKLMDWFDREGDRVAGIMEGSLLKQDEEYILRLLGGKDEGMTANHVYKSNKGRFSNAKEAKEALDEMVEKGLIVWKNHQNPKGGQKTIRYFSKEAGHG